MICHSLICFDFAVGLNKGLNKESVYRIYKMKECNSDVCEDQSRNMEMMFVVYSFYDVRRKQLVVSQQKLDDKEIQYLDHLTTGVFWQSRDRSLFQTDRTVFPVSMVSSGKVRFVCSV